MPEVREEVVVPFAAEKVCRFFQTPAAVLAISDPSIGARLIAAPDRLDEGDEVRLELMAFGTRQAVTNRIVEARFPASFVEEQRSGPLTAYRHQHLFEAVDGGTRVIDVIEFEPPGGLAGLLMTAEKIEEQLGDSIALRNRNLGAALERFEE